MTTKRAVILSSVRTGSTWLGESLKQHPAITYDEELALVLEPLTISGLDNVVAKCQTEWHLWKLQAYQARSLPELLSGLQRQPDLAVIFLRRVNLLDWFISIKVSQSRKVYARRLGEVLDDVPPFEIDVKELQDYVREEVSWWGTVRREFSGHSRFFATTYETLCERYDQEIQSIFQWLGLDPVPVATPTLKMQTRDVRWQVTNYAECDEKLNG